MWNSYVFHLLITSDPVRMSQLCAVRGEIPSGRGHGDIAQLGEHPPCKRKVAGSIPAVSTTEGSIKLCSKGNAFTHDHPLWQW